MQEHTPHDPPDLEDAYRRLRQIGFSQAVFEFIYITQEGQKVEVAPDRARVLVRNTENLTQRIYNAAEGPPWTESFVEDVKAGVYGQPPKGATTRMSL